MLWSAILAASCFGVLALAHSALGEKEILAPLFRAEWETPTPRWAVQRILRFAWHLTSIAWIGLGAAALGAPVGLCIAGVGLSSGAVVFFTLRGHLAWPLSPWPDSPGWPSMDGCSLLCWQRGLAPQC